MQGERLGPYRIDRVHLSEAKRLLDESLIHADDETRRSVVTNLRIPREIMAAWNANCGPG